MVTLFFGDLWSTLSTVALLAVLVYIIFISVNQKEITRWGQKTLILTFAGLALCCFVVIRDDYAEALQGGEGFFSLESIQINLAYIGGAVNGFAAISSIVVRNQKYRKIMFFVLSGSIIFKAVMIEASRIIA